MDEVSRERAEALLQFDGVYARHVAPLHDALLDFGFNNVELRVFLDLGAWRHGSAASWLGRSVSVEKSYLSHILRSFRDHGLITACRVDHDRRIKRIELTESGRRLFRDLDRCAKNEAHALLSRYEKQDQIYMVRVMRALGMVLQYRRRQSRY
jgi:DNA-binding MarR family transcriptional regulator